MHLLSDMRVSIWIIESLFKDICTCILRGLFERKCQQNREVTCSAGHMSESDGGGWLRRDGREIGLIQWEREANVI